LKKRNLAEFELASLANLLPETAEEAATLVPTLKKLSEDELNQIVNDLMVLRAWIQGERSFSDASCNFAPTGNFQ
jgi:hypothetical protein